MTGECYPWSSFQRKGLLWLVNKSVFHPEDQLFEAVEGVMGLAAASAWKQGRTAAPPGTLDT